MKIIERAGTPFGCFIWCRQHHAVTAFIYWQWERSWLIRCSFELQVRCISLFCHPLVVCLKISVVKVIFVILQVLAKFFICCGRPSLIFTPAISKWLSTYSRGQFNSIALSFLFVCLFSSFFCYYRTRKLCDFKLFHLQRKRTMLMWGSPDDKFLIEFEAAISCFKCFDSLLVQRKEHIKPCISL
jgi:hypothetical protein